MFARVGWAVRAVAGRIQPANLAARAVGFDLPRSFAKLPTAAIQFKQPGSLLHELTAATDATTAQKLHESTRSGLVKIRSEPDFVEKVVAFQAPRSDECTASDSLQSRFSNCEDVCT